MNNKNSFLSPDNDVYYITGLILDPSCKLDYIREIIDHSTAETYKAQVKTLFLQVYCRQSIENSIIKAEPISAPHVLSSGENMMEEFNHASNPTPLSTSYTLTSRSSFLHKKRKLATDVSYQLVSEIDIYLSEPIYITDDESSGLDVLEWWKSNEVRFPHLSNMVKDYLSCAVSSVSANAIFSSTLAITIPDHYHGLPYELLRSILLTSSWLTSPSLDSTFAT